MSPTPLPCESSFRPALPWVGLTTFIFLLICLDRAMFGPMLPAIEAEFGLGHAESTSFLFYMSLGYSCSTFLSGITSVHIKPRHMVGGSLFLSGIMLLFVAHAETPLTLGFLLVLLGLAGGQYVNGGLSTLRSLVTPGQWGKAIAVHEMGPNLCFVVGPLLGGTAAIAFGWRTVATGMGIFSMITAVVFLLIAKGGKATPPPISLKGVGEILRAPALWVFAWLLGLGIAGEFAPYSVLSMYLMEDRKVSPDTAAYLVCVTRIATPFVLVGGGWVTHRLGTIRTLTLFLIFYALGLILMALPSFSLMLTGMFIQPLFTALLFPPAFTFLAEAFTLDKQPVLFALSVPLASFLGVGLMPPLLGFCGEYLSFQTGFIIMAVFVAATIPLLLVTSSK